MSSTSQLVPRIVAVRYVRDHIVWLRFADGTEGEVDLAAGLRGSLLAPLRDLSVFARAGVVVAPIGPPTHARDRGTVGRMPEISRFFGVVIRMLANDDAPPHFHAYYGDFEISVTVRDGIVTGKFPARALRMVLEWRDLHESELLAGWEQMRANQAPRTIAPLE